MTTKKGSKEGLDVRDEWDELRYGQVMLRRCYRIFEDQASRIEDFCYKVLNAETIYIWHVIAVICTSISLVHKRIPCSFWLHVLCHVISCHDHVTS